MGCWPGHPLQSSRAPACGTSPGGLFWESTSSRASRTTFVKSSWIQLLTTEDSDAPADSQHVKVAARKRSGSTRRRRRGLPRGKLTAHGQSWTAHASQRSLTAGAYCWNGGAS